MDGRYSQLVGLLLVSLCLQSVRAFELNPENVESFAGNSNADIIRLISLGITSVAPNTFDQYKKLTELSLYGNAITELPEDLLLKNSKLKKLNIQANKLTHLEKNFLNGLGSLQSLTLSQNNLSSLHEDLFKDNSNLDKLYLYGNSFTNFTEKLFQKLTKLTHLELNDNKLNSTAFNALSPLKKLDTLYFENNGLTEVPFHKFNEWFPKLSTIGFSGNDFNCLLVFSFIQEAEGNKVSIRSLDKMRSIRQNQVYNITCTGQSEDQQEQITQLKYDVLALKTENLNLRDDLANSYLVLANLQYSLQAVNGNFQGINDELYDIRAKLNVTMNVEDRLRENEEQGEVLEVQFEELYVKMTEIRVQSLALSDRLQDLQSCCAASRITDLKGSR